MTPSPLPALGWKVSWPLAKKPPTNLGFLAFPCSNSVGNIAHSMQVAKNTILHFEPPHILFTTYRGFVPSAPPVGLVTPLIVSGIWAGQLCPVRSLSQEGLRTVMRTIPLSDP